MTVIDIAAMPAGSPTLPVNTQPHRESRARLTGCRLPAGFRVV